MSRSGSTKCGLRNAESVMDTRHSGLKAEKSAAVLSRFPLLPVQPQVGLKEFASSDPAFRYGDAADGSTGRGFQELELGQVQIRQHGAVLEKVVVELKAAPKIMPDVPHRGRFQVMVQVVPVSRMGASIDDAPGTPDRREPSQVGQSVLGGDGLDRVLGVVNV